VSAPIAPALRRSQTKDKGIGGRKAEKVAAKRMGAVLRPGSGLLDGAKGDYELGKFLIENKTSQSASFTVKQAVLHKVYQEALERSKNAAMAFQFINEHGDSEKRDRWVCLPEHLFLQLIGE
jgi:hypothetical protein